MGNILRTRLANTLPIIICCFVLHNLGIEQNDLFDEEGADLGEQVDEELPQIRFRAEDRAGKEYRRQFTEMYFNED